MANGRLLLVVVHTVGLTPVACESDVVVGAKVRLSWWRILLHGAPANSLPSQPLCPRSGPQRTPSVTHAKVYVKSYARPGSRALW